MRGEYQGEEVTKPIDAGSPPLARGVLETTVTDIDYSRITPACAGSTKEAITEYTGYRDHPRLRGEYFISE